MYIHLLEEHSAAEKRDGGDVGGGWVVCGDPGSVYCGGWAWVGVVENGWKWNIRVDDI